MPFPSQIGQGFYGIYKPLLEHFSPVSWGWRNSRVTTFPALQLPFLLFQFPPHLSIKLLRNLNIKRTKTNPHYFLPFSCAAGADRALTTSHRGLGALA